MLLLLIFYFIIFTFIIYNFFLLFYDFITIL